MASAFLADARSRASAKCNRMLAVVRRLALVIGIVGLLALVSALVIPASVIVVNVDGPPVSVEVAGLPRVMVDCPARQTIQVPRLNLVPREVVVTDARTGVVLRKATVWRDTELLIRGTTVLTGEPNPPSSGPVSRGCL